LSPGRLDHAPERTPDVRRVQLGTDHRREHDSVVLPVRSGVLTRVVLDLAVLVQGVDAAQWQGEGAPRLPGLGVSALADRAPYLDRWRYRRVGVRLAVEIDMVPGERAEFFRARVGCHYSARPVTWALSWPTRQRALWR
jgi:hypothetical protein